MIHRVLSQVSGALGTHPVLVDVDGRPVTAQTLVPLIERVAGGMQARVRPGDTVAVILPTGGAYLAVYAALGRLGAVTAGINPRLAAPERAALVDLVGASLVIVGPRLDDGLPPGIEVVELPGSRLADLGPLLGPVDRLPEPPPPDPDRPVALVFTSGTTGRPKAARFLERHLSAVERIDVGLGPGSGPVGGGSPMLVSTHPAHVGVMTKLPWYLRTGSTMHLLDHWRAEQALDLIAEHGIPTIGAVAPQLALMLRAPNVGDPRLSCVRSVIAGGAASPPALVDAVRRTFGAAYSIRYSSTESGGVGLGTALDAPDEEALETIGRPRPGVEARVADTDGRPVPHGGIGELQLRSAAVFDGYHGDAQATAEAFTPDGWLRTGDLARLDDQGCFRLAGRRTEMYIRGGYNVFPAEVEAAIAGHPAIAEVAVAPRPDPVMGEVGVAVVVLRNGMSPPSIDELRGVAATRLARFKLPESIVVVSELPRTSNHKVDRQAVSRLAAGSDPSATGMLSP